MPSIKENNKLGNRNEQRSNSGSTLTTANSATQILKREQGNNNNTREEEAAAKRTKRRTTKVGLNDTLRRIRHLIVEWRSNLEIQDILQLEERTFYRYMAKIYEIDQALFIEQEKKTLVTEFAICKDRLLKSYRWFIAIADNENLDPNIRIGAQDCALEVAVTVFKAELEGPRMIHKEGSIDRFYTSLKSVK